MYSRPVGLVHLVELIDTAYPVVCQDERTTLCGFVSVTELEIWKGRMKRTKYHFICYWVAHDGGC